MNRTEMIETLLNNPGVKIKHESFGSDEYIVADKSKTVYTEEGYIFEDWISDNHNGIRMRNDITWEEGWSVYEPSTHMCVFRNLIPQDKCRKCDYVCNCCENGGKLSYRCSECRERYYEYFEPKTHTKLCPKDNRLF